MSDSWNIIGWIILVALVALVLAFLVGFFRIIIAQELTNWKRRRAHAGKLECESEEEDCHKIAERETPNGYFCDEHWYGNVRRGTLHGSVSWSHLLNHALTKETPDGR